MRTLPAAKANAIKRTGVHAEPYFITEDANGHFEKSIR